MQPLEEQLERFKAAAPVRRLRVRPWPEQLVQLAEQAVLGQSLHRQPFTTATELPEQPLLLRHHAKHGQRVGEVLVKAEKLAPDKVGLADLCRKLPP